MYGPEAVHCKFSLNELKSLAGHRKGQLALIANHRQQSGITQWSESKVKGLNMSADGQIILKTAVKTFSSAFSDSQ